MMLLFAGLFSSVLTGFLVESKSLLQEDTGSASLDLLFLIAQAQRNSENSGSQSMSPVERPSFTIPTSARLINILWFLALALSLSTALVAMLAKEWLQAFLASRPRSPHAHALLHQARLRGFSKWHALHIIDLLPTALHFSLLLFSVGLIIYLWTLDLTIAIIVAIISGATLLFYVGTIVLVAVSDFCPFVTQVSRYIQRIHIPDWVALAEKMSLDASNA
ncbi:hypothetical protein B0J17DRAFT_603429, partial [Rhizoctonia solani]